MALWPVWLPAATLLIALPTFDTRRLLLTAILTSIPLADVVRRRPIPLDPARWPLIASILIFSLGLFSALTSPLPGWSSLEVAYYLLMLYAVTVLAHHCADSGMAWGRLIWSGFVLPTAVCCFIACVAIYGSWISDLPLIYPEPLRTFANVRFFNQYQTWVFPFLYAALLLPRPSARIDSRLWRSFLIILAVFFWALYWRSSGRGSGYAALFAGLLVAFVFGAAGRRYLAITLALSAAGFLVKIMMFGLGTGHARGEHLLSVTSAGRLYLWDIVAQTIHSHPWFGIGPMLFAGIDNSVGSHPHSAPLQWAAEWGLPATLVACSCFLWLYWRWVLIARRLHTRLSSTPVSVLIAVTASLTAGSVHAMVSGLVVMPISQFMLVTIVALAFGIAKRDSGALPRARSRLVRTRACSILSSIVLLVAATYTLGFTLYDYSTRLQKPRPITAQYARNAFQPRFWSDGTLVQIISRQLIPPKKQSHADTASYEAVSPRQ